MQKQDRPQERKEPPFQHLDLSFFSKLADVLIHVHLQSMLVSLLILGVSVYKTN